jgi:hypothetical protein
MTELDNLTLRSATRRIKGVSFEGIIRNGSYFLVDISVFEDGIVDCWEGVDLALFRKKVSEGWVRTSVPDGAVVSAHDLAHMTIANTEWLMTPQKLIERVEAIVKALNPSMLNLYDMNGSNVDRSGKIGVLKVNRMSNETWRANENSALMAQPIKGITHKAFWRENDKVHIVTVSLFDDNQVRITGADTEEVMSFEALRDDDRLSVARKGDRIWIAGLGSFDVTDIEFTIPKDAFLAELEISRDRMLGRMTPTLRTIEAFKRYMGSPDKESLEELREAYESVPAHMRRYCGNQDTKDIPIRIALYGEEEIENWSHYELAKSRGETLPSIRVPKVKGRGE